LEVAGLTVVDAEGKPQVTIATTEKGFALTLRKNGTPAVLVPVDAAGAGITLLRDGKPASGWTATAEGASFVLFDANWEKLFERSESK
jgi:hypothetical protein